MSVDLTHARLSGNSAAVVHIGPHVLVNPSGLPERVVVQRLAPDCQQLMKGEVPIIPFVSGEPRRVVLSAADVKKPGRYPQPAVADPFLPG